IVDGLDRRGYVARARVVEYAQGHLTRPPHDTCRAYAVVAFRGDDAGDGRAMPVLIADLIAVRDPVPTVEIIDEAVVVVITLIRPLACVRPLVASQIGVREIN